MRKKSFTCLQPCDKQSGQNDTDEPPSQFIPSGAGTGLNRLYDASLSPAGISQDMPVFFLSKNHFSPKINALPHQPDRFGTAPPAGAGDCFEREGFIIRDGRGRIKTIIFRQKRSM